MGMELSALYQILLQKTRMDNDLKTYKELAEEGIALLEKYNPTSIDILTTIYVCFEAAFNEGNAKESMKYAKMAYDHGE
jgi:hypothetical protein